MALLSLRELVRHAWRDPNDMEFYHPDEFRIHDDTIEVLKLFDEGAYPNYPCFSNALLNNKTIMTKYIRLIPDNGMFAVASDKLKNDVDFVVPFLQDGYYIFNYIGDNLRDNELVVETACRLKPASICDASERLKNDRIFLCNLIEKYDNDRVYMYLDETLRNDMKIYESLRKCTEFSCTHLGDDLKCNPKVFLDCLQLGARNLESFHSTLKNDVDLCLQALYQYPELSLEIFGEKVRSSKRVALAATKLGCENFLCLSNHLRRDEDVVLAYVKEYENCLLYADPRLRCDEDFAYELAASYPLALIYMDPSVLNEMMFAVGLQVDPSLWKRMTKAMRGLVITPDYNHRNIDHQNEAINVFIEKFGPMSQNIKGSQ